jgi:hypothetical protein
VYYAEKIYAPLSPISLYTSTSEVFTNDKKDGLLDETADDAEADGELQIV